MPNIVDSTNIVSIDSVRVVKITSLRDAPAGVKFYAKIHDEDVIRPVLNTPSFTSAEVLKAWNANDRAVVEVAGRGTFSFMCHTMGGPKYPVVRLNNKHGRSRNVRVTFYTDRDAVISATEAKMAKPPENVIDAEFVEVKAVLMLPAPVTVAENAVDNFEKPVKPIWADFETQPAYMQACKKYHAAMRKWNAENEVSA